MLELILERKRMYPSTRAGARAGVGRWGRPVGEGDGNEGEDLSRRSGSISRTVDPGDTTSSRTRAGERSQD